MDKLSVIIPVYNAEKYLSLSLDSVINQTYKNLEIILVDDGSTDRSAAICADYKKADERIIILHRENGGAGAARNAGLDVASGEYIAFVDSDDYVSPDMLEVLLNGIKENGADISVCNYRIVYNDRAKDSVKKSGVFRYKIDFVSDSKEFFCKDALKGWQSVCGRLFTKRIVRSLRFPEGRVAEDGYVLYDLLMRAKIISYHKLVGYFYRLDIETSVTGKKFEPRDVDMILVNLRTYLRIKKAFPSLTEACLYRLVKKGFGNMLKKAYQLDTRELFSFRKEKKIMRKAIGYALSDVIKSQELPPLKKFSVVCFYISPTLLLLINKTGVLLALW